MASVEDVVVYTMDMLGKGYYATVYRGVLKGQPVAVKKIHFDKLAGDDREVKALEQFKHPNVIKLLGYKDEDPYRLVVLELCDGNLEDYRLGKFDRQMPEEWDGLMDMAQGLAYIHSQNHVHRDIKPENILISLPKVGRAVFKIADFGLCKTTREGTFSMSSIKGTPLYLAPEILQELDDPSDQRKSVASDVFALGCTFYFYLTKGLHPFGKTVYITANVVDGKSDLTKLTHNPRRLIEEMIDQDPNARPAMPEVVTALVIMRTSPIAFAKSERNVVKFVFLCRFHPTKPKLICALDDGQICVFSGSSHSTPFSQWKMDFLPSLKVVSAASNLEWNSHGTRLAACYGNGTVIVLSEDGNFKEQLKEVVTCLRWNLDPSASAYFVTGHSDGECIVWDSGGKRMVDRFKFHSRSVNDICWIGQDEFASCSADGTIYICKMDQSAPQKRLENQKPIRSIWWSGDELIFAEADNLKIWNFNTGVDTLVESYPGTVYHDWYKGLDPPKVIVAAACECEAFIWELSAPLSSSTAKMITKLYFGPNQISDIKAIAISPKGDWLAAINQQGIVNIWSMKDWILTSSITVTAYPSSNALTWDSTGQNLAVATCLSTVGCCIQLSHNFGSLFPGCPFRWW